MSIDGRFIEALVSELTCELKNGRIQKISQLSKSDFLFLIRAENENKKLYISLSTSLARINLTERKFNSDFIPGGFCMFLRKHIERGVITDIKTLNFDRIIQIELVNTDDVGDTTKFYLVMEMFSRYTNLIILDEDYKIINAYKHISPFDESERTIVNGIVYNTPEDIKLEPNNFEAIKTLFEHEIDSLTLVNSIRGVSPLLAKYIFSKAENNHHRMFDIYFDLYHQVTKATLAVSNKTEFYYLDIFQKGQKYYESLSKLIDSYYEEASSIERIKQIYKYLINFVKREHKRKKNKLEKLAKDLDRALNNDELRIMGDALMSNLPKFYKGDAKFTAYSYELEKDIEIELDRLLSPVQNAKKYYTKYKKQKTAVKYIEQQIRITKTEVIYFDDLLTLIHNTGSLNDLLEIQNELIDNGFMSKKKKDEKKKKPNYDVYIDELGIKILVGKNNIQNNYLTHKYAKKDYMWFHAKGQTGSHVIVCQTEELEETTIRTAANLSAYYSKSRMSSSVPVDYTLIKNIKKVPGMLGSYVTFTNQKTIYIDPDEEMINKLKKDR
ncbi:MAG: NFACT family protein [Tenericutes bacterium]|nr:NFACT family protein [Mycoplasmatota bacterium]